MKHACECLMELEYVTIQCTICNYVVMIDNQTKEVTVINQGDINAIHGDFSENIMFGNDVLCSS